MNCANKTKSNQVRDIDPEIRTALAEVLRLRDAGALFVVNHSGGKDSQAMFQIVKELVPKNQILVIHAHLIDVEWQGTEEHARATTEGYEFQTVTHAKGESLLSIAERRGAWPSPQLRSCTSQLKAGPIDKAIRHAMKARGLTKVVSCMGLRAEESSNRAKQSVLKFDERNSKAGRQWFVWLPIFDLTTQQVFKVIADAGQKPHWAYAKGMSRLSCCFCIMANKSDLKISAQENPELYSRYVQLEKKIDQTLFMPTKKNGRQFLEQITGVPAIKETK